MPLSTTSAPLSLSDVHGSVSTDYAKPWKRLLAFGGPAYLVSVGYMDPGNWAADLEGGARFGYALIWVLLVSNLMAVLLQTLSARLGIVTQRDLAQACRESYPKAVSIALWGLCEIAIAACDLAEVLGAAIALKLLFGLPLLPGVLLTSLDTLLLLWFAQWGIRWIELMVIGLITVIAGSFLIEIWWAKPELAGIAGGLIPRLSNGSLYAAIAILGATVMPHNLYLHSALVQTRRIGDTEREKRTACHYNFVDSLIALNGAFLVNASILIMAAALFWKRHIIVTQIEQAHTLLTPLLGSSLASVLFAIALLCSGQSSTITGTMAGQIVMEGFLNVRLRPWLRRLVTRAIAIIPAALTIYYMGESASYQLILLSQVVLSLQLPFAVIPLIQFTASRERMGSFANGLLLRITAWSSAGLILGLNFWLVNDAMGSALTGTKNGWKWLLFPLLGALLGLLTWMTLEPMLPESLRRIRRNPVELPSAVADNLPKPEYRNILVPLDHTGGDRATIAHAAALARLHQAKLHLLHVEEDVTSQLYGSLASTAETHAGRLYLDAIVASLIQQGLAAEAVFRYSGSPRREIVRYAAEHSPDLIVMGSHGHKGIKDIIFGTTINAVRHNVDVPVLAVQGN